jgi:hypothetical protein
MEGLFGETIIGGLIEGRIIERKSSRGIIEVRMAELGTPPPSLKTTQPRPARTESVNCCKTEHYTCKDGPRAWRVDGGGGREYFGKQHLSLNARWVVG